MRVPHTHTAAWLNRPGPQHGRRHHTIPHRNGVRSGMLAWMNQTLRRQSLFSNRYDFRALIGNKAKCLETLPFLPVLRRNQSANRSLLLLVTFQQTADKFVPTIQEVGVTKAIQADVSGRKWVCRRQPNQAPVSSLGSRDPTSRNLCQTLVSWKEAHTAVLPGKAYGT